MIHSRQLSMVVVFLSLITTELAPLPAWAEAVQWRIATTMEGNPHIARAFKEFMAETSRDEVLASLVHLKQEQIESPDVLLALQKGGVQLAIVSTEQIEAQREIVGPQPLALMNYPFIFNDQSQMVGFERSYAGRVALARLTDAGLLGIEYWNSGLTQLISREPVALVSDLKGMKIATYGGQASTRVLELAFAHQTNPYSWNDIYSALENGTIDAGEVLYAEQPTPSGAFGFVTDTGYRGIVAVLVANRDAWHGLPARAQSRLVAAAQRIAESLNNQIAAEIETARSELRKQNVKFNPPSAEFRTQLKAITLRIWKERQPKLLDFFETAQEVMQEAVQSPAPPPGRRGDRRQPGQVEVLFATDRNDETETGDPGATDPHFRFGSKQTNPPTIRCGRAIVTISPDRSRADESKKYFTVAPFNPIPWGRDGAACAQLIRDHLSVGDGSRILLLVHGYANTFYDAVTRAASVATDIRPNGPIVLWSWPSYGSSGPVDYNYDETSVMYTRRQLSTFLEMIKTSVQPAGVDIIAHSMGNRAVIFTLEFYLNSASRTALPKIGNIILAAPDIATSNFRQAEQLLVDLASQRLTLYASSKDRALKASQAFARGPRAGLIDSRNIIVTRQGIDSIDASAADTSRFFSLYHAYLFNTLAGIDDLKQLVVNNKPPVARGLVQEPQGSLHYWLMKPTP